MLVNGKEIGAKGNISVKQLLEQMCIDDSIVVVEVDCEIVPREKYEVWMLDEASRVEIVSFVGGG